jgi:hypothetical protein
MKSVIHTQDSLKLFEFLQKYPNQWHSFADDAVTLRAYIVRAVNCHEELVHFVKEVKRVADDGMLTPEWAKLAKQLLAKAKGL